MARIRTRTIVIGATLAVLAACGSSGMLPVTKLFGPTMALAFSLDETDAPLTSTQILGLETDLPLSLTTDPIDL